MMTPDYETAALKAAEILDRYNISAAPVSPLAILKRINDVLVISFEALSRETERDRQCLIDMYGEKNQDAFTTISMHDGKPQYIVTYNQLLPTFVAHRALARELGHIVLGHDGTKPEEIRQAEAKCFAHHLLCPRPLIHSLQALNVRLTVEVLGNLTGCYDYCLTCIRRMPATHVAAELNKKIRNNLMPYIMNFFNYQRVAALGDGSAVADLGTFMDGYEE